MPSNQRKRSLKTFKRYEKQVPGHRIQVDVKFLDLQTKQGEKIRRYQYTAIDDATRARVLKIYERHTQKTPLISLITFLKDFLFVFTQFKQITVMNFNHSFIGIVRI